MQLSVSIGLGLFANLMTWWSSFLLYPFYSGTISRHTRLVRNSFGFVTVKLLCLQSLIDSIKFWLESSTTTAARGC